MLQTRFSYCKQILAAATFFCRAHFIKSRYFTRQYFSVSSSIIGSFGRFQDPTSWIRRHLRPSARRTVHQASLRDGSTVDDGDLEKSSRDRPTGGFQRFKVLRYTFHRDNRAYYFHCAVFGPTGRPGDDKLSLSRSRRDRAVDHH